MDEWGLLGEVWGQDLAGVVVGIDIILAGNIFEKVLIGPEPVGVEVWYLGISIDKRFPIGGDEWFPVNLVYLFL